MKNTTVQTDSERIKSNEDALSQLSPFELKNRLIDLADKKSRKSTRTLLNAGRGNPNWIATEPREAFYLLGQFAMAECRRVSCNDEIGLAGSPVAEGVVERFERFLTDHAGEYGVSLLKGTLEYARQQGWDAEDFAYECVDGIIGDHYPSPDRILVYTEKIIQRYLAKEMCGGRCDGTSYDLFATEGGTAGMVYAFDSLQANHLLSKGDTIALMTPIFTPYIEIPGLDRFKFKVINISASEADHDGVHTWQYPDAEIDKLRDPKVKLVCLVNPSNPPSVALSPHTIERLRDIVEHDNPNLMIITDDVYGTFVKDFRSLMYELPENTMTVYSFSKFFGATGWRLAVTAINVENVFDRLIAALPDDDKADLNNRYSSLTLTPSKMKFIDRMVADSRMVALNHTAGLSTPQQVQMSLFAMLCLLDTDNHYRAYMQDVITKRYEALWSTTGFTLYPDKLRAGYYTEIDFMVWAKKIYGDDFAKYLNDNYNPVDVVIRLANETAVVLLNGDGFDGPAWSVRASLANLDVDDYLKIGKAIRKIFDGYHDEYLASLNKH